MNYDVYLGGLSKPEWRAKLKSEISSDIEIFDPLVKDYDASNPFQVHDQTAKQLYHIENGNTLVVFYLNDEWNGTSSLLEIGDSVARGKQVIVCLEGDVKEKDKIRRYCDFRGAMVVDTLDELTSTIETYLAEVELCSFSAEA